jgi:CheY-like chemotaxis protein
LPDLILLDVMMPGLDGYAVCRTLKAEARVRGIPVIFVTAKQDTESEVAALAAGGVDFIHKPIVPETLRARVGLQLALRRRELELQRLNEQLAAATASKSLFLASMSHEIRTPMNAVLGLAQMLEREPLAAEALEMVRRIRAAGHSCLASSTTSSTSPRSRPASSRWSTGSSGWRRHSGTSVTCWKQPPATRGCGCVSNRRRCPAGSRATRCAWNRC